MMNTTNRLKSLCTFLCALISLPTLATELVGERIYLSGKGHSDAVDWEFKISEGRRSEEGWTTIPVPSNWEQHGFGEYSYATHTHEVGTYRTSFMVPEEWEQKHIRLVFEGSMTQTSIKVNDKPVGFPNYGGYVPFRYILKGGKSKDSVLKYGEMNTLEVEVKGASDSTNLNFAEMLADYWILGGIYRPVYLEVLPKEFIYRLAIDAKADGSFHLDVFPQSQRRTGFRDKFVTYMDEVVAQVQTLEGENVGPEMKATLHRGAGRVRLNTQVDAPELWSPEFPNLYQVKVSLKLKGEVLSEKTERFGFRTIELRPKDGLYLNGSKVMVRGMNRNVFHPDHGRTVDKEDVWQDVRDMKAMNVNLARSHMPCTIEFMRACDELGMLVIKELNNWHGPVIDTPIARNIAYELVTTYQNHPSLILWANGNESGFNYEIDELYHLYDLQNRPVIHPWSYFEGIHAQHYPGYRALVEASKRDVVYLPTEFLHGLYDGGHGAGLDEYWDVMLAHPQMAGGVLWCWRDAAIRRMDREGILDTEGNRSADGVVGPYGEKEGSYYTIREIWSPIQFHLENIDAGFSGSLPVENRYQFTNLKQCRFEWALLDYPDPWAGTNTSVRAEGTLAGPDVLPGTQGTLDLPIASHDWKTAAALRIRAVGTDGVEVMDWTWPIQLTQWNAADVDKVTQTDGNPFEVNVGSITWTFSPETGQLLSTAVGGEELGLGQGPVLYSGTYPVRKKKSKKKPEAEPTPVVEVSGEWKASVKKEGDRVVIQSTYSEGDSTFRWTVSPDGSAALSYSFAPPAEAVAYCAVGFDLPEEQVAAKRWRGDGPYRVWGNRLKGSQHGLWANEYNDAATGEDWGQVEFKGIFSGVDWMQIALKSGHQVVVDADQAFVGVLHPNNGVAPAKAKWEYPEAGGLFQFHHLPGVASKFDSMRDTPRMIPHLIDGPVSGKLVFRVK